MGNKKEIEGGSHFCRALQIFFAGIYLVLIVFLVWRCRYGFAYDDETFYLTIPYRICLGDSLLLHEWHLTQLSGILLVPLVKLYLTLFHSTEGIILFSRYVFTAVWTAGGLFLWRKLKRFSHIGAATAALCFVVYAPGGIMALSYHSMSLLLLLAACVFLITNDHHGSNVIAGILYAGAVLCSPYLVLLYFSSMLGILIIIMLKKRTWGWRWLYFSGGVMLVVIPFCVMLLASGSISDYLRVLPNILDDPQHPTNLGLIKSIQYLIYHAQLLNNHWKQAVIAALIITIAAKITRHQKLGFVLICADSVFLLITYLIGYQFMNAFMFPVCFIGLYCAFFEKDTKNQTLFWGLWIPGALYCCLHFLASNQYYYTFSHASAIMMIASLIMGTRYVSKCYCSLSEKQFVRSALVFAFGIVILCQLFCEVKTRYQWIYPSENIKNQTVVAKEGPEKGVLGNQDFYEFYVATEKDVRVLINDEDIKKVLFVSKHSWLYLSAQKEFASFSAWMDPVNEHTLERLFAYYGIYPEKAPDAILFDRDYLSFVPAFLEKGYYISDDNVSEYAQILRKIA